MVPEPRQVPGGNATCDFLSDLEKGGVNVVRPKTALSKCTLKEENPTVSILCKPATPTSKTQPSHRTC